MLWRPAIPITAIIAKKELPPHKLAVLRQFFEDYKVLEKKEVVVKDFRPAKAAISIIKSAIARYQAGKKERH